MISPTLRILIYLVGWGVVLSWAGPGDGFARLVLILALIVVSAYLDSAFSAWARRGATQGKVVSLHAFRAKRNRKAGHSTGGRGHGMQAAFLSPRRAEAEGLCQTLRAEGLRPMIVTQTAPEGRGSAVFQVLVHDTELARAKPFIEGFRARTTNKPS